MVQLTVLAIVQAVFFLPVVRSCNFNVGAYKMHNGNGEMSYMDREKSALYSEQGVWVSWKVPVPRHWDPKTGQLRNDNPGRTIGQSWYHFNQLTDDNPPLRTPSPAEEKASKMRITAPDPYREFLRQRQSKPTYGSTDEDLYFLSAGFSKDAGTSLEVGVVKPQRPSMPAAYAGALKRPSFNFKPEEEGEGPTRATRGQTTEAATETTTIEMLTIGYNDGSGNVETDKAKRG